MTSCSPSTTKQKNTANVFAAFGLCLAAAIAAISSCASDESARDSDDPERQLEGTIAYPFVDENAPLGKNGPEDRFIVRSAVGDREYAIEIPGGARDFDVEVPLAGMSDVIEGNGHESASPRHLPSAVATDSEMKAAMPKPAAGGAADQAALDKAFGVGQKGGPKQAPSYTLGLARINDYFKRHEFEYCLIEINSLLAFYPSSIKLLKMKGTVLLKMHDPKLAELAWVKALDYSPDDRALRLTLERLQHRIETDRNLRTASGPPPPQVKPVGTPVPQDDPLLAH